MMAPISAQEASSPLQLDLEGAIALALEHNYDVRVARADREVQQLLADPGNAGLLPSFYLDGSAEWLLQNTDITFANIEQPPISAEGARTLNYTAAAVVEYTLFNGGRRIASMRLLESQSDDARLREKLAMESTVLNVGNSYLEALRMQDISAIAQEAVELSLERLERARENYRYGGFTRLQLLNAEVDLRSDSIALEEALISAARAKRQLQLAMGIRSDSLPELEESFSFREMIDRDELLQKAEMRNTAFLRARNELYRAERELDQSKADRYPNLAAVGGYRYAFSDFEANFLNTQENIGWNAGVNLRFFVFDAGRIRRNIQSAQLGIQMARVEEERSLNEMYTRIANAWDAYISSRQLLAMSERQLELAEQNFERSKEAFAGGQVTGTEQREAQVNLSRSRNEISARRIDAKLAEMDLLFEAGALLE